MRIGLTYDLRSEYLAQGYTEEETAEFDREETVDRIDAALTDLGYRTDRIGNVRALVERLAGGDRWDLVFNICEGLAGGARESQVPAVLEAYGIPVTFADASVMALCMNKAWSKLVVLNAGVPTPQHAVVSNVADIRNVRLPMPVFVKPIGEGTGKGTDAASIVHDRQALDTQCRKLLERFRQPVLVETFLSGREFTVGIIGGGAEARVLGTLEIVLRSGAEANVYSYVNKEDCEKLVDYRLVSPRRDPLVGRVEQVALAAWQALGCRDAGRIDLRCNDHDRPNFIEANPLAGLHPEHSDLPMIATRVGMSYVDLIRNIVVSASQRIVSTNGKTKCA